MDFCFPNPEHPTITPNPESLKHRKNLRYLIYGQIFVCFAKLLMFGILQGIMQLFNVWIIYMSWATMSYCNLIFFMFSCGIDLLILGTSYSNITLAFG